MKITRNMMTLVSCFLCIAFTHNVAANEWNYEEQGNNWHGTCASGLSQSPINIDTNQVQASEKIIKLSYKANQLTANHNGHTVQFTPNDRNISLLDNVSGNLEEFTLVQFHLHNGSEHTVNNVRHDLEAHFVHANHDFLTGGSHPRLAVIGVFINADDDDDKNKHWEKLLSNLPSYYNHENNYIKVEAPNNYKKLLAKSNKVFAYEGSLTTPGCDEIVNWFVMKKPVTVSYKAVENFAASQNFHKTYRNTQNLNGRIISMAKLKNNFSLHRK